MDRLPHARGRMTGVETLMWRLGQHGPAWRPTMSLVVTLEGPLHREDLLGRLDRLCRVVPRLKEKVREASLPSAPPGWEPDPHFSVDAHVTERPGPLWAVASQVVAEPFQGGRAPWRAVIVGTDPGQLVLHLHHSYTDGQGGLRLVAELFDFEPETAVPADAPPGPGRTTIHAPRGSVSAPHPGLASVVDSVLDDVGHEARRAWSVMTRALPWAGRTLAGGATRPRELLGSAAALASAVRVAAAAALGPASPVLRGRSSDVIVVPVRVGLEPMRTTARLIGATVNDIFLAGLLDGLERYHAKHGSFAPSLRVGLPISHRQSGEELHNQLFGALIRGPLGRLDFAERTRLVHEMVLHGRNQPWAALIEDAAATAVRLPRMVSVTAAGMGSLDLLASNVIGSPAPMWLGGSRVEAMVPVGPRSGAAINATLLSYCSTAAIGLNLDPVAVPDPGVLVDCLNAAFEEGLTG